MDADIRGIKSPIKDRGICTLCGQEVLLAEVEGKLILLNPHPLELKHGEKIPYGFSLVDEKGRFIRIKKIKNNDIKAYLPHWHTCPFGFSKTRKRDIEKIFRSQNESGDNRGKEPKRSNKYEHGGKQIGEQNSHLAQSDIEIIGSGFIEITWEGQELIMIDEQIDPDIKNGKITLKRESSVEGETESENNHSTEEEQENGEKVKKKKIKVYFAYISVKHPNLIPSRWNPSTHFIHYSTLISEKAKLEKCGFPPWRPIVVNVIKTRLGDIIEMRVILGVERFFASYLLGIDKIPALCFENLTDEEEKKLIEEGFLTNDISPMEKELMNLLTSEMPKISDFLSDTEIKKILLPGKNIIINCLVKTGSSPDETQNRKGNIESLVSAMKDTSDNMNFRSSGEKKNNLLRFSGDKMKAWEWLYERVKSKVKPEKGKKEEAIREIFRSSLRKELEENFGWGEKKSLNFIKKLVKVGIIKSKRRVYIKGEVTEVVEFNFEKMKEIMDS